MQFLLKLTDLHPCSRCDVPQVDHVARDAQHRRQCREPTEHVGPPRVFVVHVLDRSPLHDVEDKDALKEDKIVLCKVVE